jgi:hypothetical protein
MRTSHIPVVALLLASLACSGSPTTPAATAADPPAPVVREILAQMVDAPGAPDRRLTLVRYTIAPAAQLPPHVHPGVQMASIVSGTLTYHVVSGTATVQRGVTADGAPAATESFTGPAETTLNAGDAVIENGSMVHFGANRTAAPLVILAALLTDPGSELAVPAGDSLVQQP